MNNTNYRVMVIVQRGCDKVPDEYTDVLINIPQTIKLNSNATIKSITLSSAATVIIKTNYNLDVKGK